MSSQSPGASGEARGGRGQPAAMDTGASETAPPPAGAELDRDGEGQPASRTLFRLLEPALDTVASFGAPIVIAGIVGLVAGISVVAFVGSMRTYGWIDVGIGGGLILMVALISFSSVMAAFIGRTGRYGINSAIMVAAFTGIIVVINIVSFENNRRSDVTATNQFSLARSTKQLLKRLDEPVLATAFYLDRFDLGPNPGQAEADRLSRRSQVEETFREFEALRTSKFSFRFVDFTLEPEIVRKYFGSTPTPFINESIVVEGLDSGITHVVQPSDAFYSKLEQDLYTSILVVSGQEQKTVYFLSGHGERTIDNTGAEGYDSVRAGLQGDNYDVRTLRWDPRDEEVSVPDTPGGCANDDQECLPTAALLVIAGPSAALPIAHAQALDLYLRGKKIGEDGDLTDRSESGRLIFLAEPDTPETFLDFMASWGVFLGRGYIRDEERSVQSLPQTLRLQSFNPLQLPEEITRAINPSTLDTLLGIAAPKGRSLGITRMPGAAPVRVASDANRDWAPLAFTSSSSYLINDLGRTDPITGDGDDADPRGPFSPVVYVQAWGPVGSPAATTQPPDNEVASMVVFGDSDFITNANYLLGSGADFFLNSANYLLGDFSLVSIRPKAFTFRELNLNRNEYNFVRFSSLLFMPGLLGLMAGFVWWIRR